MPSLRLASSTGLRRTKLDKRLTKGGSFSKTSNATRKADEVANLGAGAHAAHEPTVEYLHWELVAQAVRVFWLMVGPKRRDRPEAWPRARLPAPAEDAEAPQALPVEPRPQALVWKDHADVLS
eukprot:286164-Amphidinium_carterae.1